MSSERANPLFPSSAWRFLLPTPSPGRTVYFGPGEAAAMARELPGRVDPASRPDPAPADLVVGDDPRAGDLRRMFDRLRPGGTLYVEYHRPRGWRPADRLRRRVAGAGFDGVRVYSVSPRRTFHQPTWWIPRHEPAAVAYLMGSRRAELTRYSRWRRRLEGGYLSVLTRLPFLVARSPWWLHPGLRHQLCLVARRPCQPGTTAPAWVPEPVAAAWPRPDAGAGPGPALPYLLRVGGTATDRAILVVLDRHRAEPLGLVKLPTIEGEIEEAEREAAMLASLARIPGVPRLAGHWRGTGYAGLAQSFVPGDRMDTVATGAELAPLAAAVTTWLADFAAATARPPGCQWLNDLAHRSLDDLAASLPAGDAELGRLLARSGRLLSFERSLPPVAQHRDLGPWNLLAGPDRTVGVIDWVDGTETGVPLADLVHFLTHLALSTTSGYRPDRRDQAIRALLDAGTEVGALMVSCQQRYAARLAITAADIPRLRVLTWILDILRQDPEHRATSLYLDLWKHEVHRAPDQ